jgi:hypothetical protein
MIRPIVVVSTGDSYRGGVHRQAGWMARSARCSLGSCVGTVGATSRCNIYIYSLSPIIFEILSNYIQMTH